MQKGKNPSENEKRNKNVTNATLQEKRSMQARFSLHSTLVFILEMQFFPFSLSAAAASKVEYFFLCFASSLLCAFAIFHSISP